jgi:alkane 1-monooxygenase
MTAPAAPWTDWRFALGLVLPLLALNNIVNRPWQAGIGTLVILFAIALLEATVPALRQSPPPSGPRPGLAWLLRAFVPLQLLILGAGLVVARQQDFATVCGLALAAGFITGAQGITYAHELGHSRSRGDRALAWLLMTSVSYPHFMVEHYRGHHVRAATWDDPASARRGESLWRFLPRTLSGSLLDAWRLEALRLRQRGLSWVRSPLLWCTGAALALPAILASLGESRMLLFWLLQSAVAIWLLETVNYIEHYGLQRARGADGRSEPFGVGHAWNADHAISNSLLANLQRHSDHHMHAWKPYGELQVLPGPQLPTGYAGCILLAAVPPAWFALVHRRLDAPPAADPALTPP